MKCPVTTISEKIHYRNIYIFKMRYVGSSSLVNNKNAYKFLNFCTAFGVHLF